MWVQTAVNKLLKCFFLYFFVNSFVYGEKDYEKTSPPKELAAEEDSAAAREPASRRQARKRKSFGIKRKQTVVPKSRDAVRKIKQKVLRVATPPKQFRRYFQEGTDEAELDAVINEEIQQLFSLIKTSPRRDLRLRLGSLYIEKVRLIEYRLYEKYDREMKLFNAGKKRYKPRLNMKPTRIYIDKAVKLFETYRRQYPKDRRMDQVLFFLGVAYFKKGQLTKGKRHYETLVKKFPKSEYITDVNFELAEYYFNQSRWKQAVFYYKKMTKNPRLKMYSFALYKLAWCYFNMGQVERALVNMESIIKQGLRQSNKESIGISGAGKKYFSKEALGDLVLFYGSSKRSPARALSYFEQQSGSSSVALKMLKKLAYAYSDSGHLKGMRITFKQLIEANPESASAYKYQHEIIRAYTSAGKRKVFLRELKFWLEKYGPSSYWAKLNRQNPEVLIKARSLMQDTLREYALRMHQSYQKTKDPVAKNQALFSYDLYNRYFKRSKQSDQMHFFHAELLFDIKKYKPAGQYYQYLVENYMNSKYYEQAALNSVLSFEKTLPSAQRIKKLVGKSSQLVPFTPAVRTFQKAADYYVTHFSSKPNVPAVIYKKGELNYEFNHHKEALKHFWHIIKHYPRSKFTEDSANLILDIHNLKKDFESLKKAAVQLLKNPVIAGSQSAKDIHKIISQIGLKSAEDMAKGKKYAESARLYKQFADKNPQSPLQLEAYYNAGFYYKKSGDLLKTLALYNKVLKSRKTSVKRKKTILEQLPDIYKSTGRYRKAAESLSSYVKTFPKSKIAADSWYDLALIYDGFNRYTQAEQAYLMYFKKSRQAEKTQALYLLAEMLRRRGHISKAVSYYNQFLNRGSSDSRALVESAFRIAEIKKSKGQIKASKTWYGRTVNLYKKYKAGVYYAAQAEFINAYDTYVRCIKIKIPRAPKAQSSAVKNKLNLFNKLKEDLKSVIRYDSAEQVVASLVLIGMASDHIGDAIYYSPLPKGLNKAEIQQYRAGLKKTSEPFKTEAVNNYELAVNKAKQLGSYEQTWLKKALGRLSRQGQSPLDPNPILRKMVAPVIFYDGSGA